jgi:hypothetical protein
MSNIDEMLKIAMADLTVGDLGVGGKLRPEQADSFFVKVMDTSKLLKDVRSVSMNADQMNINKIGLGSQILYPANAGTRPYPTDANTNSRYMPAANRFNPAFEQITLNTVEYIAETLLTDDALENNLEQENLPSIILDLAAKKIGWDLERLLVNGDTAAVDPTGLLNSQNGVLKRITSNTVAAAGAWSAAVAGNVKKALPTRFRNDTRNMKFYLNPDVLVNQQVAIAARQTMLGDASLQNGAKLNMLGVETEDLVALALASGLYINPKNIIVGVQRSMRIESIRDPRARATSFIITTKLGIALEEEEASVKVTGLTA